MNLSSILLLVLLSCTALLKYVSGICTSSPDLKRFLAAPSPFNLVRLAAHVPIKLANKSTEHYTPNCVTPKPRPYCGPVLENAVELYPVFYTADIGHIFKAKILDACENLGSTEWYQTLREYYGPNGKYIKGPLHCKDSYDHKGHKHCKGGGGGSNCEITDDQIQSFLTEHYNSKFQPPSCARGHVHFLFFVGEHWTIVNGDIKSCVKGGFCAYHGAVLTGHHHCPYFTYSVYPDLGPHSPCYQKCGASDSTIENTIAVISHEIAEVILNPKGSLATVYGPPLGWVDHVYGEIADICIGPDEQAVTKSSKNDQNYVVQKIWSNQLKKCTAVPSLTRRKPETCSDQYCNN